EVGSFIQRGGRNGDRKATGLLGATRLEVERGNWLADSRRDRGGVEAPIGIDLESAHIDAERHPVIRVDGNRLKGAGESLPARFPVGSWIDGRPVGGRQPSAVDQDQAAIIEAERRYEVDPRLAIVGTAPEKYLPREVVVPGG